MIERKQKIHDVGVGRGGLSGVQEANSKVAALVPNGCKCTGTGIPIDLTPFWH